MTESSSTVTVAPDDALDDVLRRLHDAGGGRPVDLIVPTDSSLLLTAAEFRALKDATDRGRLAVTIRTADPLRLQLARLLGVDAAPLQVRTPPSPAPIPAPATAAGVAVPARPAAPASDTQPAPAATNGATSTAPGPVAWPNPLPEPVASPPPPPRPLVVIKLPTFSRPRRANAGPAPAIRPQTESGAAATTSEPAADHPATPVSEQAVPPFPPAVATDETASSQPAVAEQPAASAATVDAAISQEPPAATPDLLASDTGAAAVESAAMTVSDPDAEPAEEREIQLSARAIAIAGGVLLALLIVGGVVAAIRLPRATVDVALKQQPVQAELLYDVTTNGAPLDPSVALVATAKPITTEVVFETTMQTTGKRLEPDQPATGSVRLVNIAPTDLTVGAGTVVTTEDGVEFAFIEDVTVPAASGDGSKGTAVGNLRAVRPGAGGNVDVGTIGGKLPNGVFYMNRDAPTAGGSDREIAVVSEDDVDGLLAQAETALPEFVRQQLTQPLADGSMVLPATITIGEGNNEFDHQAGDVADTLRLRVVREISAMAYQPQEVRARASEIFRDQLAAQAPPGYQLDVDAIALYPETVVEERAEGTRFRLVAEGRVLAVFDAEAQQSLAAALAGTDPNRAEAILRDVPQIERFEIAYAPAWFPDRMPGDASRIVIRLIE